MCKVPVVLFDLPAKEGPKNAIVTRAVDNLKKLKPSPLGVRGRCRADRAGQLRRATWPSSASATWSSRPSPSAWTGSSTSTRRSRRTSPARHPRVQHLRPVDHRAQRGIARCDQAALLRHPLLQPAALHGPGGADRHADHRARDPGRPGSLRHQHGWARAWCAPRTRPTSSPTASASPACWRTMKEVEKFGLTLRRGRRPHRQEAGARASSGTFRTADVVGLDTMAHVVKTLQDNAERPRPTRSTPASARRRCSKKLLELGHLGQKTKAGFFKKAGRDILRFDLESEEYVPAGREGRRGLRPHAEEARRRAPEAAAQERRGRRASFLWSILRDGFHYAAVHLATIADTARDVDFRRCAGASA
jgi:3-hydroxyacyl-CoA dehydrogenase